MNTHVQVSTTTSRYLILEDSLASGVQTPNARTSAAYTFGTWPIFVRDPNYSMEGINCGITEGMCGDLVLIDVP